jgi:hypothetical protein
VYTLLYLYSVVMIISFISLFVFARCCRNGRGKEKHDELMCFECLYELADADSLAIETCRNVEWPLLNWVVFDWRVCIAILRAYCNIKV